MLKVNGKPAIIKSNICILNTVEEGRIQGYFPRLDYCSLEEANEFQQKLEVILNFWHIPFYIRHTVVLDLWTQEYHCVPRSYKDDLERILCMYFHIGIDC